MKKSLHDMQDGGWQENGTNRNGNVTNGAHGDGWGGNAPERRMGNHGTVARTPVARHAQQPGAQQQGALQQGARHADASQQPGAPQQGAQRRQPQQARPAQQARLVPRDEHATRVGASHAAEASAPAGSARARSAYAAPGANPPLDAAAYDPTAYAEDAGKKGKKDKKPKKPKKPMTAKRVFAIIGVVLACLVVLGGIGLVIGVTWLDKALMGDKSEEEMLNIKEQLSKSSLDKPFYMMLIGSDEREGNEGYGHRSDTAILARIDPVNYIITLTSIQRDTKINLGGGIAKFNAAYAYDGAAGCIREAQKLTGVKISHFAEVNFGALTAMVDAVGGVDIKVGQTVDDWWAGDEVIEEGWQCLNGKQALILARARHYGDDDYTRANYQRTIIHTLANKILALPASQIAGVLSKVVGYVSTDLSATDIYALAMQFKDADKFTFYSADLPSYQETIDGVSYVIYAKEDADAMLALVDAGKDPNDVVLKSSGSRIGTRISATAGEYDENGNVTNK